MSELRVSEPWVLLSRARGVGLLLRILIGVSSLAGLACTLLAADESVPVVKYIIIALSLGCVVYPDGHLGLAVVVLIGIEWWVTVDDPTTPWSIAVAASLAVFHTSMAAAGVVAPSAAWTRPMCRRWLRRCSTLALAGPAVWALAVAFDDRNSASSQVLLAASVMALVLAGVWARSGTLVGGRPG
jgi:hypothetical protein